jgi:CubicO group peptidase (beta-lactamase class C family)
MAARSPDAARLAAVIAEVLHRHPAGGLAVGVVGRGGLEFFEGFGVADTARGTPITQDTVFRIGSISKTFTAIAVMQLRDRGFSTSTTPSASTCAPTGSPPREDRSSPRRSGTC